MRGFGLLTRTANADKDAESDAGPAGDLAVAVSAEGVWLASQEILKNLHLLVHIHFIILIKLRFSK